VRNIVAPDPLAQATVGLAALTPRSVDVTPLVCGVQTGAAKTFTMKNVKNMKARPSNIKDFRKAFFTFFTPFTVNAF
jgi:hypothetical protein